MNAQEQFDDDAFDHETNQLRSFVLDTINEALEVTQPPEYADSHDPSYFDPRCIRGSTYVDNDTLDPEWERECAQRLRPVLRDHDRERLLVLLVLARIGRGALVTTVRELYAQLSIAFPEQADVLRELTTGHATTLAEDLLTGYRRARLGGEDEWMAQRLLECRKPHKV